MPLDPETMKAIIASAVKEQEHRKATTTLGPATKMICSCGGVLHDRVRPPPLELAPPKGLSRRRRVRKKQLKRWVKDTRPARFLIAMVHCAGGPTGFTCGTCFRHVGFYAAICRNMFTIEPLPPGALPIYDHDPDVAAVVIGDGQADGG